MKNAVRYYSRSGNTKTAAEAIARAIGTDAVSVDSASAYPLLILHFYIYVHIIIHIMP